MTPSVRMPEDAFGDAVFICPVCETVLTSTGDVPHCTTCHPDVDHYPFTLGFLSSQMATADLISTLDLLRQRAAREGWTPSLRAVDTYVREVLNDR